MKILTSGMQNDSAKAAPLASLHCVLEGFIALYAASGLRFALVPGTQPLIYTLSVGSVALLSVLLLFPVPISFGIFFH